MWFLIIKGSIKPLKM